MILVPAGRHQIARMNYRETIVESGRLSPSTPPPNGPDHVSASADSGASPYRFYCTAMLGFFSTFGIRMPLGCETSRAENQADSSQSAS